MMILLQLVAVPPVPRLRKLTKLPVYFAVFVGGRFFDGGKTGRLVFILCCFSLRMNINFSFSFYFSNFTFNSDQFI